MIDIFAQSPAQDGRINQIIDLMAEQKAMIDGLRLHAAQMQRELDQYRLSIYMLELRLGLKEKQEIEKGISMPGEFDKRWPIYLENDVGVVGKNGKMKGELKVTFYGDSGK